MTKTNKKLKLVGPKPDTKKPRKVKKPSTLPTLLAPVKPSLIIKTSIKWDDAYPYVEETYRTPDHNVQAAKYISVFEKTPAEYEKFLFEVARSENIPPFIKNNFKKIRKNIEKEIQHRHKLGEKLTKEQKISFMSYFKDNDYFGRTQYSEYFDHEIEKVYVEYLKAYFDTGMYESHVRLANKKRRELLKQHGII